MTRLVEERGWRYTIADDDPVPGDARHWAVLRVHVYDELTDAAPRAPLRLTANVHGATARVADGGLCGLVARPRDVWQALVTTGALRARIEAPGFLPLELDAAIDAARRRLNTPALATDQTLDVLPPDDPALRQFRPGRGVLFEPPPAPLPPVPEFHAVAMASPPPAATAVPIDAGLLAPRAANTPLAGVPLVLGRLPMHRAGATRLRGTVRRRISSTSALPAPDAQIGIQGIWRSYGNPTAAPAPPDLCAVEPPLRFAHAPGGTVQTCTLTAAATLGRMAEARAAGARRVLVEPAGAFNPAGGERLRLGDALSTELEIVVTAPFAAPPDATGRLALPLTAPTAYLHRAGEALAPVMPGALSAPALGIATECQPGDRVLFAAGLGAFATAADIVVESGTAREAYYRATQYPVWDGAAFRHLVAPDANGRLELPPIARVARLRVFARRLPHADQNLDFALDHDGDNTLAIVFS